MKKLFIVLAVVSLSVTACKKKDSATCSDGIQNQNEAGVDCGGPCACCVQPTTFDFTSSVFLASPMTHDTLVNGQISVSIPLYFSPNGDGFHESFYFQSDSITGIPDFHFIVRDDCSTVLFEATTTSNSVAWDGTYNGGIVPAGTYNYSLSYSDNAGNTVSSTGQVQLYR